MIAAYIYCLVHTHYIYPTSISITGYSTQFQGLGHYRVLSLLLHFFPHAYVLNPWPSPPSVFLSFSLSHSHSKEFISLSLSATFALAF